MITQQNFWYFFGGTWLGVGAVLAAVGAGIGWHEWTLDRALARNGATAAGVVLAKSMTRRKDREPSFHIEYRYTPAGGAANEGAAEVDGKTWDSLAEGGAVTITYARDDPRAHRVAGQSGTGKWFLISMLSGLGGLLAISGAIVLWRALARRRQGRTGAS